MAWDTAANIINDSAAELGLTSSDAADPFDSTDQNIFQLCRLVKRVGQTLLRVFPWTHLQKEYTFNTADGTSAYALPTDYDRIIDQSGWNRTTMFPLGGPLNAQQWQQVSAQLVTSTMWTLFRTVNNQIKIYPTPSGVESIYYEYISRYWVMQDGQSAGNTENCTDGTDTILFDRVMFVCALKLAFLRGKNMPVDAVQQDFADAYDIATGKDGANPILYLSGQEQFRMLDERNAPTTGFALDGGPLF